MQKNTKSKIPEIIKKYEKELLGDWIKEQLGARVDYNAILILS
ncbi:MAG: hypothetical protein U1D97_04755 [Desulfuromonadales bacterium]|nr:hypothetical protein [Desulfuromonadales bacterium]